MLMDFVDYINSYIIWTALQSTEVLKFAIEINFDLTYLLFWFKSIFST